MATNTALLGLVIGAFPSIFDKESTSQKLVSIILLILILIVLILPTILLIIIQVPSLLLIILIASLDWFDDDTWLVLIFFLHYVSLSCRNSTYVVIATLNRWFMLATVTSHWFYSQDYPNYLVNTKTCPIPTFHTCVLHLPNSQVDTAFKAVKGFITECCSKVFNSLLQPEDAPNP